MNIVIYHKNCSDGFGSALAAWTVLGDTAVYHAASHGSEPPDVTGKNVIICDFSYKYDVLEQMIEKAENLIIIDHHKTAQEDLEKIPDVNKIFNMNHSGAYLTWKYFHPNEDVPKLILHIEDRDIWTFNLPDTKPFFSRFKDVPMTFKKYSKYLDPDALASIISEGKILWKSDEKMIHDLARHSSCKLSKLKDGNYYMIAYLNSNVHMSDLGNMIVRETHPYSDFAVIWYYNDITHKTSMSLRSLDEKTDVSQIAKLYGGGGHRNASGARFNGLQSELEPSVTRANLTSIFDSVTMSEHTFSPSGKTYSALNVNLNMHVKPVAKCMLRKNTGLDFVVAYHSSHDSSVLNLIFSDKVTDDERANIATHYGGKSKWGSVQIKADHAVSSLNDISLV